MIVPSSLATSTSLTHIYNLCEVVNKAVLQSAEGFHTFNVADKKEYHLKSIFSEILIKKCGKRKFICIPTSLLKLLVGMNLVLGRRTALSIQALSYLTHNATLNVEKAERELSYVAVYNFYDSLGHLDL